MDKDTRLSWLMFAIIDLQKAKKSLVAGEFTILAGVVDDYVKNLIEEMTKVSIND